MRNTSYEETIRQLGLQGNKALRLGADTTHKLTYGVDNTKSA